MRVKGLQCFLHIKHATAQGGSTTTSTTVSHMKIPQTGLRRTSSTILVFTTRMNRATGAFARNRKGPRASDSVNVLFIVPVI